MKIKVQHIIFALWNISISVHFACFLYNAEYFRKMHVHDFDGGMNLCLALVTAVLFGVLKLLKKTDIYWFFIPIVYGFTGVIMSAVYSSIPCCVGG